MFMCILNSNGSWFGVPQVVFLIPIVVVECSWVSMCWSMNILLSGVGEAIVDGSNVLVGVS